MNRVTLWICATLAALALLWAYQMNMAEPGKPSDPHQFSHTTAPRIGDPTRR
ncbi:hypothetical protein LO762_11830 [Actinocorallia sp. API 0066]|uniref:hypothetical protein n=1 Tax=Actinocorallia sp. API 0066 TaxID=2896846 RepID=UPI001E2ED85F|nr:hypothetical protein [Actinocorallia sp. API 0066]MCD0449872.1 hypothetical protein [Actinocorallia sp. API 0066]